MTYFHRGLQARAQTPSPIHFFVAAFFLSVIENNPSLGFNQEAGKSTLWNSYSNSSALVFVEDVEVCLLWFGNKAELLYSLFYGAFNMFKFTVANV